jgi:hypothetical protein
MNTPEHLATLGILADPTTSGRERYTHKASGRAVVRADWMSDVQWIMAVSKFAAEIEKNTECDRTPAPGMNEQTPGPLTYRSVTGLICTERGNLVFVADTRRHKDEDRDMSAQDCANARLLAASYTLLDRTGRELGVDAAELAEKLDLVKLIQAARDALTYLDQQPDARSGSIAEVAQCGVRAGLRQALYLSENR